MGIWELEVGSWKFAVTPTYSNILGSAFALELLDGLDGDSSIMQICGLCVSPSTIDVWSYERASDVSFPFPLPRARSSRAAVAADSRAIARIERRA